MHHLLKHQPDAAAHLRARVARHPAARWLAGALLTGLCAGPAPALATTLGFDSGDGRLLGAGDSLFDQGWRVTALADGAGLAGAVLASDDYSVCNNMMCPAYATGNYYAALNDGSVRLDSGSGSGSGATAFYLAGFDASFIGTSYDISYPATAGMLLLVGRDASGASVQESYSLAGPDWYGFGFGHYSPSATFASHAFSSVTLSAFSCDLGGTCSSYRNQAQFALDNVNLSAVPEPASYALLLAGLATISVLARRHASRASTGRTA